MKTPIEKAIDNNHGLYEAIFHNLNIAWIKTSAIWYCVKKVPPYHSNIVTRRADWSIDSIFEEIDGVYEKEKWEGWSIKDSFNKLNLRAFGFKKIFDAQWMYLESTQFISNNVDTGLIYTFATDSNQLQEWRIMWNTYNDFDAELIYNDVLLHNPDIYFVLGKNSEQKVVTACLLNKTDDVIGISNFYTSGQQAVDYWSSVIEYIQKMFGPTDIVGYERNVLVETLKIVGMKNIGDLAVWAKKRTDI